MACEILLLWPRVVFNLQISQVTRVPYSPAYAIQESDESRYPNEVQYCISWEVYQISDILVDEVFVSNLTWHTVDDVWIQSRTCWEEFIPIFTVSSFHLRCLPASIGLLSKYYEESLLVNRWSRKNISQSPSIRIETNSIAQRKDAQPCTICQAGSRLTHLNHPLVKRFGTVDFRPRFAGKKMTSNSEIPPFWRFWKAIFGRNLMIQGQKGSWKNALGNSMYIYIYIIYI